MKGSIVCRLLLGLSGLFRPDILPAQVWDDFSDGNFTQGVSWTGDTGQFVVSGGMLQLSSTGSDSSFLVTPLLNAGDTTEWSFLLKLAFAPSSMNYARVYLVSDQPVLEGPLNGYFLQFGETGGADAVVFYRQSGWTLTPVFRGRDSLVAQSFVLAVQVLRFPGGQWQLFTRAAQETSPVPEGSFTDNTYAPSGRIGWRCSYTTSNAKAFFLDEVYAGPFRRDTLPPVMTAATFTSATSLLVTFSEKTDAASAGQAAHYQLTGIGAPVAVTTLPGGEQAALTFAGSLADSARVELCVQGIADLAGNTHPQPQCLTVYRFEPAHTGDVVITEVMANPANAPGLPPVEYVEVYNRGRSSLVLNGWWLHDASTSAPLPDDTLHPGQYRVYADAALTALFDPLVQPHLKGVAGFPALNNSGDHLEITDASGQRIDVLDYSLSMYRDPLRDDHGWSLERQDVGFPCHDPLNWKASVDPSGGTPGRQNSRWELFTDTMAPWPVQAFPLDDRHLLVTFSEYPDTAGAVFARQLSMDLPGQLFDSLTWDPLSPVLRLRLTVPLDSGRVYQLHFTDSITDCAGNRLSRWTSLPLALPVPLYPGSVVLNEILFNPYPEGSDFVEVYNAGNRAVNLATLIIARADPVTGVMSDPVPFSATPRLLLPGAYAVATDQISDIHQRYRVADPRPFCTVTLPGFPDDEGVVVLMDQALHLLDRYAYREDHHFPLLTDPEGVSLERISFAIPASDSTNWHSAAESAGFATPGARNSQALAPGSEPDKILRVDPVLFTPDNDGFKDTQFIRCQPAQPGYVAQAAILGPYGEVVRTLARQELLGDSGQWIWDGLDDTGAPVAPGIYVAVVELFHINGRTATAKAATVVARPLMTGN